MLRSIILGLLLLSASAAPVLATIDPQSDGSDGVLDVTSDRTLDLAQAVTGTWTQPGTGTGVYDPAKWAVVYKFSSVNVAAGRTLRFANHPSGAPVVWLVQGNVTIAGTVNLDGENGNSANRATVPGPGGFPGGRGSHPGSEGTAGYGPGGGGYVFVGGFSGSGSYATQGQQASGPVYGNERILPLIGGSGGAGTPPPYLFSGGAGGGALLIVAGAKVTIPGAIRAYGGLHNGGNYSGTGSGGAVRIVADSLAGAGDVIAVGSNSYGGHGRIRFETNGMLFANQTQPDYSLLTPLGAEGVVIWPPEPAPTVRIATINGVAAPADPRGNNQSLVTGDLTISATSNVPVTLEATNVPTNAIVTVRVVLGSGDAQVHPATFQSGDATASTWSVNLTSLTPARVSALQAKVVLP